MEYESSQFKDGVGEAIRLVTELVIAKRGQCGGTQAAIRTVAKDCSISAADVRRLMHPSRRPKDVRLGLWLRLSAAYRRYLAREISRLEHEVRALESLGNIDPRTAEDLACEAQAVIRRIKQHL